MMTVTNWGECGRDLGGPVRSLARSMAEMNELPIVGFPFCEAEG
jgi:hypothetical protein